MKISKFEIDKQNLNRLKELVKEAEQELDQVGEEAFAEQLEHDIQRITLKKDKKPKKKSLAKIIRLPVLAPIAAAAVVMMMVMPQTPTLEDDLG